MTTQTPILYTFRRCPYAIRARMALHASGIEFDYREVSLKNKPPSMLAASPKGTVPVFILTDGTVLEESLDIMLWALTEHDPYHWMGDHQSQLKTALELIEINDLRFKPLLDRYKYSDRFPDETPFEHRENCAFFLELLNERLKKHRYLIGDEMTVADIGVLSFIRQFAHVDKPWFDETPYSNLKAWLDHQLNTPLFLQTMEKRALWEFEDETEVGIEYP